MKLHRLAAVAWFVAAPVFAAPAGFNLTFEKTWDYFTDVAGYYGGGTAGDGTSGPNVGVRFSNVYALSNSPSDPFSPYYSNAPSPLGVVTPFVFLDGERAFMNVANGVGAALSFFYSSPTAIAIQAYSGLNGTGSLIATINLAANSSSYDTWNQVTFAFGGFASSFDFTNAARGFAAFDNISAVAVPEPETMVLLVAGGAAALCLRGRRRTGSA